MKTAHEERRFAVFCFLTDMLLFWLALNIATLARVHTLMYVDPWRLQIDRLACTFLFACTATMAGAYDVSKLDDPFDSVYFGWVGLAFAGFFELILVSLLPTDLRAVSRRELILGLAAAGVLLGAWRYYAAGLASRFESLRRFFFVLGSETEGRRIATAIQQEPSLRADAEYVQLEALRRNVAPREARAAHGMEEAIVALSEGDRDALTDTLAFCQEHCRRTFLYPALHDTCFFQHGNVRAIAGVPLIDVTAAHRTTSYLYAKRLMDIAAAGLGLLLALPICIAATLAIKMTSPGGVFYGQTRVGKDGRTFKLYKFRSMVADAEANTGPVWAASNDTRVTPVGRFIRKHRVDEIPQLISVLKGDMSLVGPRPERPHFHEEFREQWPLFDKRLAVRPGLTSLSHVLGSYGSDPEDRLRYDLIYIGNLSLLTDMRIIIATVRVVLGAKGAQ